jgi:hypothetical protein
MPPFPTTTVIVCPGVTEILLTYLSAPPPPAYDEIGLEAPEPPPPPTHTADIDVTPADIVTS